jgi:hypothetical protein
MKKELSVFLLDRKGVETHKFLIDDIAEELRIQIKMESSIKTEVNNLEEGYDIYFLHLDDINPNYPECVSKLKEEQPWSYVVGYSGALDTGIKWNDNVNNPLREIEKSCDEFIWMMDLDRARIKHILQKNLNRRLRK